MSIRNIVILGAGGNAGPPILAEFLKSDFRVTVCSRPESNRTFPPEVKVVKTNYDTESLVEAFKGQDAVISIVGYTGIANQIHIFDAAIKAGVKRIIPSEFGINTSDERVLAMVPALNAKRLVVDWLVSKEKTGISWTAVITGPFLDLGLKRNFPGFDIAHRTVKIWDAGVVPFSTTNLPTVGKALVATLSPNNVAQTANKYVYIESHNITQRELVTELENETGQTLGKQYMDSKQVVNSLVEASLKGDFSATPLLIQAATYSQDALGDLRQVEGGLWNERLYLPQESLEESIKKGLEGMRQEIKGGV